MKVSAHIQHLATAVPPHAISQAATLDYLTNGLGLSTDSRRRMARVLEQSGIETRHSVLPDFTEPRAAQLFVPDAPLPDVQQRMAAYREHALPLALEAARRCISLSADAQVTHLVVVSCTGMYAPGLDIDLVKALGLSPTVQRTGIQFMGCYAALNGLRVAQALVEAQPQAQVLLLAIELCSLHVQPADQLDALAGNILFSDGAAAALITSYPAGLRLLHSASALVPDSETDMAWEIGPMGFHLRLSSYVPKLLGQGLPELINRLKDQWQPGPDVAYAVHPGGVKILEACQQALDTDAAALAPSYEVLRHYGNMSSPTVLFVLERWWQRLKPDQPVWAMAFGPGLTVESTLMQFVG